MQFKEDATVLTATGEKVGKLDRIVVDPVNRDVSHLVVTKGMLLPRDSLVPIEDVDGTPDEETVVLQEGARPERFAEYVADRYTTTDPSGSVGSRPLGGPGFVLYPIPGLPPGYPGAAAAPSGATPPPSARPTRAEPIQEDTKVLSVDGQKIGKVEEVITLDDGSLDAIVAKSGILWFTRRRVIPAGWIREVRGGEVRLTVPKQQVLTEAQDPSISIDVRPPGR